MFLKCFRIVCHRENADTFSLFGPFESCKSENSRNMFFYKDPWNPSIIHWELQYWVLWYWWNQNYLICLCWPQAFFCGERPIWGHLFHSLCSHDAIWPFIWPNKNSSSFAGVPTWFFLLLVYLLQMHFFLSVLCMRSMRHFIIKRKANLFCSLM